LTDVWLYPLGTALGAEAVDATALVDEYGPVRDDFLQRTGFERLYRAAPDQTGLDLAIEAIGDPSWWSPFIDTLIYVSSTGNLVAPGNAHLLQSALGLTSEQLIFDLNDACTGFVKALQLAGSLIDSGVALTVLLVLSDTYSKLYEPGNLRVSPLFSDGASAVIVSSGPLVGAPAQIKPRHWQFLSHRFISEGSKATELAISRTLDGRPLGSLEMNGAGVLNFVLSHLGSCVTSLLADAGLEPEAVDRWYAHQGSRTVVGVVEKAVKAPAGSLFRSAEYGNTVGSSLPFQLVADSDDAARPQLIGLLAFGVGLTMAGLLVRQLPVAA
jgi:3-oxoacyl-[acyl-carrier-protein] synthase-3